MGRAAAERALAGAPEVLAVSPHGADLRVVIRSQGLPRFEARAKALGLGLEATHPDFEDVYLGLLATHATSEDAA
jgi:ABC-2 type transport system ATP-binding protein